MKREAETAVEAVDHQLLARAVKARTARWRSLDKPTVTSSTVELGWCDRYRLRGTLARDWRSLGWLPAQSDGCMHSAGSRVFQQPEHSILAGLSETLLPETLDPEDRHCCNTTIEVVWCSICPQLASDMSPGGANLCLQACAPCTALTQAGQQPYDRCEHGCEEQISRATCSGIQMHIIL